MLGWADSGPLTLTSAESTGATSNVTLFDRQVGQVTLTWSGLCIACGDFSDNYTYGHDHVVRRLKSRELERFISNQLSSSNIFSRQSTGTVDIRAQITDLAQESSIGAAAEKKRKMSSGAVLTARMSVRYDMYDGEEVVGSWTVSSSAQSNSLAAATRIAESFDLAAKRNVRALILTIIENHNPKDAHRARLALAQLESEVDSTRTAFGYLMFGAGRTAGAVGAVVEAVAENGGAIAAGMNEAAASSRAITSIAQHPLGQPTTSYEPEAGISEETEHVGTGSRENLQGQTGKRRATSSGSQLSSQAGGAHAVTRATTGNASDVSSDESQEQKALQSTSAGGTHDLNILTSSRVEDEEKETFQRRRMLEAERLKVAAENEARRAQAERARLSAAAEARAESEKRTVCMAEIAAGKDPCGCAKYLPAGSRVCGK